MSLLFHPIHFQPLSGPLPVCLAYIPTLYRLRPGPARLLPGLFPTIAGHRLDASSSSSITRPEASQSLTLLSCGVARTADSMMSGHLPVPGLVRFRSSTGLRPFVAQDITEAHIKVQPRLPDLQRPRRYLAEHVDALNPKISTSGASCGASPHSRAEKQFVLEHRVLALYKAGFSFEIIRTVLVRTLPTPYDVGKNVLNAARVHKGGDKHMQAARISSFSPSHTPENNSGPARLSQIYTREHSRSSQMPSLKSSGRKSHCKVTRNEMKQNTESSSKREKRDDDARRKDSAQLSAASRAGEFLAPETQVSTRS
ncbi:hypothetical protein B0H13DRAFT_2508710 [Mycena leptocephala]|nr:hypothetical protein B0H13DRAFT_2508710 [Mycena leptocephala]